MSSGDGTDRPVGQVGQDNSRHVVDGIAGPDIVDVEQPDDVSPVDDQLTLVKVAVHDGPAAVGGGVGLVGESLGEVGQSVRLLGEHACQHLGVCGRVQQPRPDRWQVTEIGGAERSAHRGDCGVAGRRRAVDRQRQRPGLDHVPQGGAGERRHGDPRIADRQHLRNGKAHVGQAFVAGDEALDCVRRDELHVDLTPVWLGDADDDTLARPIDHDLDV